MGPSATVPAPPESLAAVEAAMLRAAGGAGSVSRLVVDGIASGGCRVRARLALGAAAEFGLPTVDAVGWAAACELLHNASLLHDDVQDGEVERRGRPALHRRHGVPLAVALGDHLLAAAFLLAAEVAEGRVAAVFARAVRAMAAAQARELDRPGWWGVASTDLYQDTAGGKSGALMALCLEGPALLAGIGGADCAVARGALVLLGTAYQVADDLDDLLPDLGRGAPNAVSLCHLLAAPAERRPALRRALADGAADRHAEIASSAAPAEARTWCAALRLEARSHAEAVHHPCLRRRVLLATDLVERGAAVSAAALTS